MTIQEAACLTEALKHLDAGRNVVPCFGKVPVGRDWGTAWRDPAKLEAFFDANPDANLGLLMGSIIDIESDTPEQDAAFDELFQGVDVPATPGFPSTRGKHYFFKADARLTALERGVIYYGELGIRVGAGNTQIQSVIPPSRNQDGTLREWTLSFDDVEPAELPAVVVNRILESVKKPTVVNAPTVERTASASTSTINRAVSAMLRMNLKDHSDGSRRLFSWTCRAVEHGLTDMDAICAIRHGAESMPFPRVWTDEEIIRRIRDAEKQTTRGLANPETSLWTPEGRTDAANAGRLASTFGDDIHWCDTWRKWLGWDGQRWAIDDQRMIDGYAKTVAKNLWREVMDNDPANAEVVRFVRASNSAHAIQSMVSLCRSEPAIPIRPDRLDQAPFLFNVANGTLDLHAAELRPHSKADYLTKLAPVEYISTAECPVWLAFLGTVFGEDPELIGFVKRLCGYCLTGDVREQILAIFHGTGSNGKTTFLNVVLEISGDYGFKATESLLVEKSKDSHPTSIADLAGKRLAVASETGDGARLAESRIKELTGGEKVRARRMREDNWEFDPTHKIILSTNHRPVIAGTDHAIWRRIRLVPFDVTIPDDKQDKELATKLRSEYPGILAWMVEGCLEWQRQGLGLPSKVAAATAAYKASEDLLAGFFESCCEVKPDASAPSSDLLRAYLDFSGDRSMSARSFAKLLRDRGLKHGRVTSGRQRGRNAWLGVQLALPSDLVERASQPAAPVEESHQLAA